MYCFDKRFLKLIYLQLFTDCFMKISVQSPEQIQVVYSPPSTCLICIYVEKGAGGGGGGVGAGIE